MAYANLTFDVADRIATITVNRPDKLNALNAATIGELGQAIDEAVSRDDVGGVILTGAGRAFIAGADISEMSAQSPLEMTQLARRGQLVFRRFELSPKPVIAAVNGFALGGGCEIAMACHLRIAGEHAKFGQPEVKLGLIPGYGGTQRLPRLVGKGRALQLLMTGEMIDANEAFRIGLVNAVVPSAELADRARAMLGQMLANAPVSLALCIAAVNAGYDLPLDEASQLEAYQFGVSAGTEDMKEGTSAFLARAPPAVHGSVTEGAAPPLVRPRVRLIRLALRDFRNFERQDVAIPTEGLVVIGENGHGKSNLLEAVYYLQLLRSVRGARDTDLVRFGAPAFHLSAEVERPHGASGAALVGVGFERSAKKKRVRLDGAEPPRLSDALGALPSVIFSPGDVRLVSESPSERRRYLDVVLALTSRRYLAALQSYRGALLRRNAALRDVARTGRGESRAAVWEPALAEHGAVLWMERRAWVTARADAFASLCAAIGERAPARMRYATSLAVEESSDATAAARAALERALEEKRGLDLKRGLTHAGPHRDDLELTLGGRDLRLFGSAGQQRTAAIALRMLEAATLRDAGGSEPLFLLDDPFAELDARRAHRILELLGDAGLGQTILVVPRATDIPAELTRLERRSIRDGVIA